MLTSGNRVSKYGLILAMIYWLLTISFIIYSKACSGMFCGLIIVVPVLPWPLINSVEHFITDSWFTYTIIVVLNTAIFYLIGSTIQKLIIKSKEQYK